MNEPPPSQPSRKPSAQTIFLAMVVFGSCVVMLYVLFADPGRPGQAETVVSQLRLEDIPFNGTRAYEYLKQLSAIGPRPSGSAGMEAQQKLLVEHFQRLGARVELQRFQIRHPLDGSAVPMANVIARWFPERKTRILLCAHYDTLPFPMLDPQNPRGVFVGANDGASGVAVLMELAHEIPKLQNGFGIDLVMLDGEEFIFQPNGRYFLGSEYFARQYAQKRSPHRYRWGILLDMVGDADLQLYQERNSMWWSDTRPLVEDLWATAARLGVREFIAEKKYEIRDDHLPLHDIGGIPICDVIDFDYPPWHTQGDTPDKCSALSLAKVGWVVHEWLKTAPTEEPRKKKSFWGR